MVKCPTSLLPMIPAGMPTARPDASNVVYSPSDSAAAKASITGVSAFFMALPESRDTGYSWALLMLISLTFCLFRYSPAVNDN